MYYKGRVKRIRYLSPMRAAKVQASLRIRTVSLEPPQLAHTNSESRGTFRQKARSLAPLNGWACEVKFVMTECSKTQIRLTGPIYAYRYFILNFSGLVHQMILLLVDIEETSLVGSSMHKRKLSKRIKPIYRHVLLFYFRFFLMLTGSEYPLDLQGQ